MNSLRDYAAGLLYLKTMHEHYELEQMYWGGSEHSALLRLVMIGWMERKPFDQTDLSEALFKSRQTVARHVEVLVNAGWVAESRQRNRVLVHPTPRLIMYVANTIPLVIDREMRRWQKLMTALSAGAQSWSAAHSGIARMDFSPIVEKTEAEG